MNGSAVFLFFFLTASLAIGQIPRTISYQGELQSATGVPVGDGSYQLTFSLYTDSVGGNSLFTETQTAVVVSGLVNAIIGKSSALPAFNKPYYLGISVNGGSELTPRTVVTSVPYALHSAVADGLTEDATLPADFKPIAIPVTASNAVGDLWESYPNPKVVKLQRTGLSAKKPKPGEVLLYNGHEWAPSTPTFTGILSGGYVTIPQTGYYHISGRITAPIVKSSSGVRYARAEYGYEEFIQVITNPSYTLNTFTFYYSTTELYLESQRIWLGPTFTAFKVK